MHLVKKTLLLLFILVIVKNNISCSNKIIFERKIYNSSTTQLNPSDSKANISMEVVQAKNSDSINKTIFNTIKEISNYIDTEKFSIKNYKDLTRNFIYAYQEHKNKYKAATDPNWEYLLDSNIEYENESYVNIVISYYSSLGDEGYGAKRSLIFDKVSGNQLKLKNIFNNLSEVSKIVETEFRTKYQIPQGNINSTGFHFPNNAFFLTDNITLNEDSVTFIYNINEIAPFDQGTFEVSMKTIELEKYLLIK